MADFGFAPYEEAASRGRARLSFRQGLGAALSGLGNIPRGANFGEAFLSGLGGASRNVMVAQAAAEAYAQRQYEAQQAAEDSRARRAFMEAQAEALKRPPKPEKPEKPEKLDPWNRPADEQARMIDYEARLAKARAAGRPAPAAKGGAAAAPKPVASKPSTGAEKQTLSYFNRMKNAEDTIQVLEGKMAKLTLPQQYQLRYAPNQFQSADQQKYRQAQRAFTEARLRKESGAAIPQGEYDTDALTYFAQPGDTKDVRAQKRAARKAVLDGLKFSSGKAYNEFYGEETFNPDAARQKYGY